jgi:hypothetical protein
MMSIRRCTQAAIACMAALLASGCATHIPVYVKALEVLRHSHAAELPEQPDPTYRYLRIQVNDAPPAMLVLGYEDAHPQGPIEVWYSARQEVIKTQNGRIIGTAGLPINWDRVQSPVPPPHWPAVSPAGHTYQRLRDLSPGYRADIAEPITVRPHTGQPDIPLPARLAGATGLQWFSETVPGSKPLPAAWFAWGQHRGQPSIVYSRQCLTPQYCLQLQRWPQEPAQP